MKALQIALANLRDATKSIDAADRVILLNHIDSMKPEYVQVAQEKTFELVFSVIDSWNDLVDEDNFKDMIESFTAKMAPIIEEYFNGKFPEHMEMMRKRNQMKLFTIWREGYKATGDFDKAARMGSNRAETFEEACHMLFKNDDLYDPERNTWWGCRLFDNETDARRIFG